MKTYYRVANKDTKQGLWYDSKGNLLNELLITN
jgi:hypothetical protein